MKCSVCNETMQKSNESCFLKVIEKRIRKATRLKKIFKKNDNILVFDDLSYYLVNRIIKDLPKKIFHCKKYQAITGLNDKDIKDYIKKRKINKIIVHWSLDDEICQFLESIFFNKKSKKLNVIRLCKNITEKELDYYCKVNKINHKKNKKNRSILSFLDALERRYIGTKFKLLKSAEKISELS